MSLYVIVSESGPIPDYLPTNFVARSIGMTKVYHGLDTDLITSEWHLYSETCYKLMEWTWYGRPLTWARHGEYISHDEMMKRLKCDLGDDGANKFMEKLLSKTWYGWSRGFS